jgi:hypothetical protein
MNNLINQSIFYVLTISILLISFGFEINGLILFFGMNSIFIYVGILISICKIYFGFIHRENKYFILIFTFITLIFASLDIYVHYRNSLGLNDKIKIQMTNVDSKLEIIDYDLNKIRYNKSELIRAYGTVTKRNDRERELNSEQEKLLINKDFLIKQKLELKTYSNFEKDISLIKFLMIFGVELLILLCIKIHNKFKLLNNKPIEQEQEVLTPSIVNKPKRKYTKKPKINNTFLESDI